MDKKKIILITGGASGIGFGTIEYLLEQRNYEIISVSRGEKNIALAKEKLRDNVNRVTFLQGDISLEKDCKKIYEEINNKYSRLDGLVNSAGIIKLGGIEEQTLEEWNNSININLTGIFLLTKTLLPLLKKGTNPSIDTIVFGNVANTYSVFLIQNMFPVTKKYVESQYIKNKVAIRLSNKLQKEVIYKANKVLNLYNHGMKNIIFPNVDKILEQLLSNNN